MALTDEQKEKIELEEGRKAEEEKYRESVRTSLKTGVDKADIGNKKSSGCLKILLVLSLIGIVPAVAFSLLGSTDLSETSETTVPKAEKSAEENKARLVPVVLAKLSNNLDTFNQQVGSQFFESVRIEEHGAYWAIFTISDDWYNLEPHVKERLVKIVVAYFKEVEGGLNRLAEVSLEDRFKKELATGYYSSRGIDVEILEH